jgi:hypothetical protein
MTEKSIPDRRKQYEQLSTKLTQLHALLEMTYGGASEPFNDMSDDLRDNYMWACSDMARESVDLLIQLSAPIYLQSVEVSPHG